MKTGILALLGIGAMVVAAPVAEIRVVGANPLQEGLAHVAEQYKRDTGHDVKVHIANTGEMNKLLASADPGDVLIATPAIVGQAVKDGRALGPGMQVARVGIGVVVRRGARVPDVSTPEALKQAVLAADGVVYNTAGSGQYVHRMFEQMGIAAQIQARSARPANAAQTAERMLQGKGNEIGLGLISEMKVYEPKGLLLVAPLPAGLQNYTDYEAAVLASSKSPDVARDFLRYLTTPAARRLLAAVGID